MEANELLKRYAAGIRDFKWADLRDADLAGASLAGINLSKANLRGAILTQANLANADLSYVNLSYANLLDANLTGANLKGANLSGAIMANGRRYDQLISAITPGTPELLSSQNATIAAESPMAELIFDPNWGPMSEVNSDTRVEPQPPTLIEPELAVTEPAAILESKSEVPPWDESEMSSFSSENILLPDVSHAVDAAAPPVTSDEDSPDESPRPQFHLKAKNFLIKLPWIALLSLGLAYCGFGQLLTVYKASFIPWGLAWAGSMIWAIDETWLGFMPLLGTLAVMATAGIPALPMGVAIVTALIYIEGGIFLDFGIRKSIQDGLWVSGIILTILFIMMWLFISPPQIGGFITVLWGLPMGWLLLVSTVMAGYGTLGLRHLKKARFSRRQIIQIFAGVAGTGLFLGWLLETQF